MIGIPNVGTVNTLMKLLSGTPRLPNATRLPAHRRSAATAPLRKAARWNTRFTVDVFLIRRPVSPPVRLLRQFLSPVIRATNLAVTLIGTASPVLRDPIE